MKRAIHTIVTLLLIVEMTLQPTIACMVATGCASNPAAQFTCEQCGCCEVETPDGRCSCCSGHGVEHEVSRGDCCGHNSKGNSGHDDAHQHSIDADNPANVFDGVELAEGPQPESVTESELVSESSSFDSVRRFGLTSACTCMRGPVPPGESTPQIPVRQSRDVTAMAVYCTVDAVADARFSSRPSSCFVDFVVSPHFSQIAFCVWRL